MSDLYETRGLLAQYLLLHYGSAEQVMPWKGGPLDALEFPRRSVEGLIDSSRLSAEASALDLGCAVGRSSFELAKRCRKVLGIDFSQRFIDAAQTLQRGEGIDFEWQREGHSYEAASVRWESEPCSGEIVFRQGDAQDLPAAGAEPADVVHAANLICRLPGPADFLSEIADFVKPGGQLLLTTPATWLEEFTARDLWPKEGTLSFLKEHLSESFKLDFQADLPFVIRETERKYQWTVALGTRWIKI